MNESKKLKLGQVFEEDGKFYKLVQIRTGMVVKEEVKLENQPSIGELVYPKTRKEGYLLQ